MRRYCSCLAVVLLTVAFPVDAGEWMTMVVSPQQSFGPTNLTIRVRLEPNAENRILEVVTDSPEFYSSSQIQLDGERAPRTIVVQFRSVPSGEYEVSGSLLNSIGRTRASARQRASVLSSGQDR
jgi:hypothetical protein